MRPTLAILLAAVPGLLVAGAARPADAQFPTLSAYPACLADSSCVVWSVFDPGPDHVEWVGFDVLRRALPGCQAFERANDEIIPRMPGPGYTLGFGEPAVGKTVEYRVVPVDADRRPLFFGGWFCSPCNAFANCPPASSPVTAGTLVEVAPGFVYVIPCPGTCYPSPYFANGVPPELAPYVGSPVEFSLYGTVGCGTVEGCVLSGLDRWEFTTCVTPVARRSWGRLKAIYR